MLQVNIPWLISVLCFGSTVAIHRKLSFVLSWKKKKKKTKKKKKKKKKTPFYISRVGNFMYDLKPFKHCLLFDTRFKLVNKGLFLTKLYRTKDSTYVLVSHDRVKMRG